MSDLIVTSVTPNVKTGRGVRTYGVAAALARHRDVEVAYVVFDWPRPAPEYESLSGVRTRALHASRLGSRLLEYVRARLNGVPDGLARGASPELARAATSAPADVRVIADGPTVAGALLPLARARPIVYLAHNLESQFRGAGNGGLKRFERDLLVTFAESWMATRADERGAKALGGKQVRTRYVPNVVDLDRIEPVSPAGRSRVLFVGDFTYSPNREGLAFLAEQVLPLVWEHRPELRLSVVGRGLDEPLGDDRIEVLGFVDDLRPAYQAADIVAVPLLHGGGSPLKFIEALAYGLPVVATDHAGRLLEDAVAGQHFVSVPGPREFARALEQLLGDPRRGAALGAAGSELVRSCYSVDSLAEQLAR